MEELGWPTQDDQRIAASAILRIQFVYDLATRDVIAPFYRFTTWKFVLIRSLVCMNSQLHLFSWRMELLMARAQELNFLRMIVISLEPKR